MRKLFSYSFLFLLLIVGFTQCKGKHPVGDPDNAGLILPCGFEALSVVDSIGRARHMAVNDNGDIYVKLEYNDKMKGRGGTVGLRDTDGDGKADSVVYFGDYTDVGSSAVGMSIHNGYLYTSTVTTVLRNKFTGGSLVPTSKTEVILTDTAQNVVRNWHTTKPVAFDNNGHMYVPFGSPTDDGMDITKYGPTGIPGGKGIDPDPELEKHAGVWRFDASKTNLTQADGQKFATGLRSIVGMVWNPEDKNLYAVVNGIDNFHTIYPNLYTHWQAALLPAESFAKITEGANFGWPYAYFDQLKGKNVLSPAYGGDGEKIERAAKFDEPVIGFPGHWAPMDLLFYHGTQFPDRYRKGVFIAFHGSTDRSPYSQSGFIVVFAPLENGKSSGNYEIFADGFAGTDTIVNTSDGKYRPMGLAEGPDGSLYITESNQGKIWRVMYKGDTAAKAKFGEAQLAVLQSRMKTIPYIKTPDSIIDNLHKSSDLEGGILYNTYCASCHQRDGKGDNNRFPPLAGSDFVTGDKAHLIKILLEGLTGPVEVKGKTYNGLMPAVGGFLDDHAIGSILTYIRKNKRFGNSADIISPYEVSKTRTALKAKKGS